MELIIACLLLVLSVVAIVANYRKRRVRKPTALDLQEPIEGTEADRIAAENALREMPIDIRETLLETHELFKRFPTSRGYSREYLEELSRSLQTAGVANEIVMQEAGPTGFADSIFEPRGIFELYIEKGKKVEAERVVSAFEKF